MPHLENTLEEAEANSCAQLTVQPTKQPAACQEEVQLCSDKGLGKLQNSILKNLPTGTGYRRSATEKAFFILRGEGTMRFR